MVGYVRFGTKDNVDSREPPMLPNPTLQGEWKDAPEVVAARVVEAQ